MAIAIKEHRAIENPFFLKKLLSLFINNTSNVIINLVVNIIQFYEKIF